MSISTLQYKGRLAVLDQPIVMGILNVTPDSFFDGGRYQTTDAALRQAETMLREGAAILDIGGASSRPGAEAVPVAEELRRVIPVIEAIQAAFPEAMLSIDTWSSEVAKEAVAAGAGIVNDISAGQLDPAMFETVAALQAPYILMHMKGRPETMQQSPTYADVVVEVLDFLIEKTIALRALGVKDLVVDPGFGFGKTIPHNFELLRRMSEIKTVLQLPVLAGLSRKSTIYKTLGVSAEEALNGATALHMVALQQGADILRVHDVKEARQTIQLFNALYAGA